MVVFPQIALAIRVLTLSIGVRVRRFVGFVLGGLSGRVPSEGSSWWCVWVSVRGFFGFLLGGYRFLQCNNAKVLFRVCCCFAS